MVLNFERVYVETVHILLTSVCSSLLTFTKRSVLYATQSTPFKIGQLLGEVGILLRVSGPISTRELDFNGTIDL